MSKMVRGCLIGILACLSLLTAAQAAGALTVSPSGAYTAASRGSTLLTFASTGQSLTCTSSQIGATISSNGSGTSPAGSFDARGCSNVLLGAYTITQTSAWRVNVLRTALTDGRALVGLDMTIPTGGVQIRNSACTYTLSGTINLGRLFTGPLPVTIMVVDTFSVLSSRLTTDSAPGCSALITVVGLTSTYTGTYSLNRGLTVSG